MSVSLIHSLVSPPTVTVTRPLCAATLGTCAALRLTERTRGGERRGGRSSLSRDRGQQGEGLDTQEKAPESV